MTISAWCWMISFTLLRIVGGGLTTKYSWKIVWHFHAAKGHKPSILSINKERLLEDGEIIYIFNKNNTVTTCTKVNKLYGTYWSWVHWGREDGQISVVWGWLVGQLFDKPYHKERPAACFRPWTFGPRENDGSRKHTKQQLIVISFWPCEEMLVSDNKARVLLL